MARLSGDLSLADSWDNGSGTLRGRWELVQPGDPEPTADDLLTEASLPLELRTSQRRWRLVERFEVFLPPSGQATLPGPDPRKLDTTLDGPYKLLLRVEASDDKEATSNTGGGRLAIVGGVAGFPMPVLRYHVESATRPATPRSIAALAPAPAAVIDGPLHFNWIDPATGATKRHPGSSALSAARNSCGGWKRWAIGEP